MGRASEDQIIAYGDLNSIINASTSVAATGYTNVNDDNTHATDISYTFSFPYQTVASSVNLSGVYQYNIDFTINDKFRCFNMSYATRHLKWTNTCDIIYSSTTSSVLFRLIKTCITTGITADIAHNADAQTTSINTNFKISVFLPSNGQILRYNQIEFRNTVSIEVSGGAIQSGYFNVYYTGTTSINSVTRCEATYKDENDEIDRFLTYSTIKNLGMSTSLYVLQNSGRTTQMVVYHDFYKARYISTEYTYYIIDNSAGAYTSIKTTGYTTDRIETITSAEISGLPSWLYFSSYSSPYLTFVSASRTTTSRSAQITVKPRDCRTGTTFTINQIA